MRTSLRFVAKKIFPLIADIEVRADRNLLNKGGCVVATNHLGRLDSLMAYHLLDNQDIIQPFTDKYKDRLLYRFFAWWMQMTWLTRGQADMKAIKEFIARLKKGGVMVIAPEGTRSKSASLLKGESGAIFIAAQAGAPIIPVAVTGTEDAVVKSRWRRLRRLKITLTAGAPFILPPMKGADRERLMQAATDEVMCRIAALLPESYRGHYKDYPRVRELLESKNQVD
ncbi:MAG: Bifunctional protein Aas [Anaerolineales bacterium]|nr:Bifunctional protein Aas [Anaerolineales bacterium]